MFAGVLTAFAAMKAASAAASPFLRPLLDPRVLIVLGAFLLGAKGCDTWHDYLGLRAERAAIAKRLNNEREQRALAEKQAAERAAQIERLEKQTHEADKALDHHPGTADCPCRFDRNYLELHNKIGN